MTDTINRTAETTPDLAPVALCHRACPVCEAEISHYQAYCEQRAIAITWTDISAGKDAPILDRLNLDREDVKRRMTVLSPDGTVYRGIDAFLVLWRAMPRYNGLARLISFPGIYQVSCWTYDTVLAPLLYRWNVARGR